MRKEIEAFFRGKRVLVLGFGLEGKSTLRLLEAIPCEIGIADQRLIPDENIGQYALYSGENYLHAAAEYDIIMKSPGVVLLDIPEEIGRKITSQTDLLLRYCENTIVGITGTKGKSTVSSLLHHILGECGVPSMLIGNIGVPPLERMDEFTPDTVIVCEMSCHQLEYVSASPDIAVLLNIYEEHLDHYTGFSAYRRAKENVFRFQGADDLLMYSADLFTEEINALPAEKLSMAMDSEADVCVLGEFIEVCGIRIPVSELRTRLAGRHNLYNIAVALAAAVELGCSLEGAKGAVEGFDGLEHRLERFATVGGVEYVNDSISTIPRAAIGAVLAFPGTDTLIVGGMDRGIDYAELREFLPASSVKNVIALPDSGRRIVEGLGGALRVFMVDDMEEAVKIAAEVTRVRCILSPAAASYGVYRNFEERGRHFKGVVRGILGG